MMPKEVTIPDARIHLYKGKIIKKGTCSVCGKIGRVVCIGTQRYCDNCAEQFLEGW